MRADADAAKASKGGSGAAGGSSAARRAARPGSSEGRAGRGAGSAEPPDDDDASAAHAEGEGAEPGSPGDGRALRFLFHVVWVFAVPLALAVGSVWLLTPAPDAEPSGGLRSFVAEQQVPACIVLFAVFAVLIYRFRHVLPLAAAIGVGLRSDVPKGARVRFEDARALVDESQRILRAHRREVERELTRGERQSVDRALDGLERAMRAVPFDEAAFDAAHARADRTVGEHLSRWRKGELREYAESIGVAIAVALILRAFVVEAFKIPSGSMIPTLMIGDHIFVNKLSYGPLLPGTDSRVYDRLPPERGDVMVFKFPENKDQDFIKRAIAVPGDTLEALDGRPIINGWLVPHCHVGTYRQDSRTAELYVEFLEDEAYFTLYDERPEGGTCVKNDDCAAGLACRAGLCGVLQGPFEVRPSEVYVMGDNRNNSHDSRSWNGGRGGGVPFENIKGRATFVWMSFGPGGGIAKDRLLVDVMGESPTLPGASTSLRPGVEACMKRRPKQTTPPRTPSP